jgi:hypothetical protein
VIEFENVGRAFRDGTGRSDLSLTAPSGRSPVSSAVWLRPRQAYGWSTGMEPTRDGSVGQDAASFRRKLPSAGRWAT